MEYVLMFILIFVNSKVITIKLKNKIETNIPIAIIGIILVVYIFGLFDKLIYGVYTVIFLTVIEFIFIIYYFVKYRKEIKIKETIFTPGILVYILLGLVCILFNKGIVFREYDEFSHWGLIVKNMFEFGNYGTNSIIQYSEYPPFISIFQYILLILKNTYAEDTIMIGLNLLYLSFMMPLLKNIKWDKSLIKLIILVPVILIMPIIFYDSFYTTLFMDGFLSCLFSYTICSWFIYEGKEKSISVILGCIAITLTKSIGIVFAIVSIIIFLLDTIIKRKEKSLLKSNVKLVLLIILFTIVINSTWQFKIVNDQAQRKWDMGNINVENIVEILQGNGEYYQKTTIKNYLQELFEMQGSLTSRNMNAINLVAVLIGFGLLIVALLKDKEQRKRFITMSIVLILFWIAYIIVQLLVYLFIFTPEEAMILACLQRYLSTIPFAIILINIFFLEERYKNSDIKSIYIAITLIVIISFLPIQTINEIYIQNDKNKQDRISYRTRYEGILKYKDVMEKDDKVYYISNFADGREIIIVRYEFLPFKIANESSKLTMTKDEFVDGLIQEGYTHIYINYADRILENKYKDLFIGGVIENKTMYKVINQDNKLLFSKVESE